MEHIIKKNSFCLALFLGGILLVAPWSVSGSTEGLESQINQADQTSTSKVFEYQLEGRPDPFLPFISKQVATQKIGADDIVDDDVELTGMRKFEPGQLTLVAVMFANNRALAMVEDVTGKGYVLKEGMPIGRRGVVHTITEEQVTVLETAHTRAGRKLENKIVMRLNKEGDK